MTGFRGIAAAVAVTVWVAAPVLVGCTRTSDGMPVADGVATASDPETGTVTASPTTGADPGAPSTDFGHPDFGVVPTSTAPMPAGTVTCEPGQRPPVGMVAKVGDATAPVVTVAVPDGWSMQGGSGDVGAQLKGPDGATAKVTIAATTLGPQEAFAQYAQELTADAAMSSLSVLPAELCDYSGQKLLGTISDTDVLEFVDRVVHVWTNGGDYLVAVHTEAPSGTSGFDSASTQLTEDFEVRIP